ncbi:MAG: alpha/beta fold hydrolase [Saprospiraceae bacterium]
MNFNDWKNAGQFFIYKNQHQIFYQETGSGETLLMIHGFPTASWDWNKIWNSLAEKYHLVAPDLMGFGFSDKPKKYNYSIMDQADLIEDFLKKKKITSAHILAHDYGDTVLQEILARFIDRKNAEKNGFEIQSVVLLNGGLFPETHQALPIQKLLISPIGGLLVHFLNRKKLKKSFDNIFGKETQATEKEMDEFYALMEHNNGKMIFHKLIRYISDRKKYRERWVAALQNSPIPILLINGAADPISGKHMTERYRELIPKPVIVLLKKIGHYPQTESPKEVLEAYFDFREKIK